MNRESELQQLLERRRQLVQRELARERRRRSVVHYVVPLALIVCTIVLGLWVQSQRADAAPSCVSATRVARIHPGQLQRRVERHTPAGQRVMADTLTYGVEYPSCDTTRELVVLYMRHSHRVATVFYVSARHG